ncbi:hypothetical protein EJ04DRAFT_404068, partial [Polyplosphaeria fusca]
TLISLTKTTQTLLTHFQSSLLPPTQTSSSSSSPPPTESPLATITTTTTLLKSHTTTLSLLLLTPPLTPSALISKIGDVSSGALSSMVSAASTSPPHNAPDALGQVMRAELRASARRVLGAWGEVLGVVVQMAERRQGKEDGEREAASEVERKEVLGATGVVWEACDAQLRVCGEGVVGLVVRRAEEWRAVLLDAVEELREWGEEEEGSGEEEEEVRSGGEEDEDEVFGAPNKLGKGDEGLRVLLEKGVKRLKMVGMLYQALIKRRLKTFPKGGKEGEGDAMKTLDQLMALLRSIPESVDDLASAFYDLDEDEAKKTLDSTCGEAKTAVGLVKQNWAGKDDEFTAWSTKWVDALDA